MIAGSGAEIQVVEIFQRLNRLEPAALGAEEPTPEALPFLRFEAEAQERFDVIRIGAGNSPSLSLGGH